MSWDIIQRVVTITVWGGLAHLTDIPIRMIQSLKVKRFFRYGTGTILAFPAVLLMFERVMNVGLINRTQEERQRLMWDFTSAYFMGFVSFGIGVVIAHVLEQILTDE
jgi:hypothetical protein